MPSSNQCFVIAEIGVNHNGSLDIARQLIDIAADAGADAVKIQTFKAESLIVEGTKTVAYQQKNSTEGDQYKLLKSLELSQSDHYELVSYCLQRGIEFMSTGFDLESLRFLVELGIKRIKIPSGEITNSQLVEMAATTGLPLIVSTGMATLEEVAECIDLIRSVWQLRRLGGELCILHCTSAYPTQLPDVNLRAMRTMHDQLGEAVGYSDHTEGIFVPPLAVAAGAKVIEKHITLDRTMAGPDHAASIEPHELSQMIASIRRVEVLLGDGVKVPAPTEIETRALVRKGLKFSQSFPRGHMISEADLCALRPETGLPPSRLKSLIGRRLASPVAAFAPAKEDDFSD